MKLSFYLAGAAVCALGAAGAAQAAPGEKIEGQYICVFKAGVTRGNVRSEAARAIGQGSGRSRHVYENSIKGFATNMSAAGLAQMQRRNPNIAYCEQDQEVSVDGNPFEFREVGKPAPSQPGQTVPPGVTFVGGGTSAGSGRAWVIDSGIDMNHPDLKVSQTLSRNFVTGETSPEDLNGHGTHVAGTIAALANNIGVVGVAPGAEVVAVRVLNRRGSGSNSDVIKGVDYVAGAAATEGDVANMSLSGGISQASDDAVKCAADGSLSGVAGCTRSGGIRFTLAAGNDAINANNRSPARANGDNIYTVASTTSTGTWSSFSNYGTPPVDYAEPGSSVYSTYKGDGYTTLSGTSMAAPHLAGLLLLGAVRDGGTVTRTGTSETYTIGKH
jgi:subtilisin family serine protease